MVYIFLIAGFILLIKGADFFVEGSSSVAKRLRVPSLIIGMTIVAMGTSFPECSVSINASIAGSNGLAISNAVGSNIFNLMVVCGFCTLFCPLAVDKGTLKKEFPFSIIVALILLAFGSAGMVLGHIDGIILTLVFAIFLYWMVMSAKKARAGGNQADGDDYEIIPVWKCIFYILGGIIAIIIGGDVVVDSASKIAAQFGMSDNLIGLTVVAFGTSLPELVTSVVAAKKNEVDMALGNVIGSNIFNILLVLGVAAAISPVAFVMENIVDIVVLVVMSLIVWWFAWSKQKITRGEGIIMLLMYAIYVVYICIR
ncbi:MAG: calcium/sodium antiporter [Lachnospiraceae bacterium]|jgi:K+-dependent Na+/Ca+ exchanger related-protein|nr:calcium/sodium antiporter [Lachnospiraceae bacterium]